MPVKLRRLPARAVEVSDAWSVDPTTLKAGETSRRRLEVTAAGELVVRDFGPGVNDVELRTLQLRHVRHSAERAGYACFLSREVERARAFASSSTLRMRMAVGVTSTHSSSRQNSRHSSRVS